MEQTLPQKKRLGISQGELVGAAILIIGATLMFWKTTDVRLSALELRMNGQDKMQEQINLKLDKLQESINTVNLTLKDKVDRKQ
jgi:uncharacterized coiled-coil protein SlyX